MQRRTGAGTVHRILPAIRTVDGVTQPGDWQALTFESSAPTPRHASAACHCGRRVAARMASYASSTSAPGYMIEATKLSFTMSVRDAVTGHSDARAARPTRARRSSSHRPAPVHRVPRAPRPALDAVAVYPKALTPRVGPGENVESPPIAATELTPPNAGDVPDGFASANETVAVENVACPVPLKSIAYHLGRRGSIAATWPVPEEGQ